MSDDKTVPTEGVDRGHTMVVWPARPKWGQPGAGTSIGINPDFDPTTGNGWLPEEDGYSEALPTGVPANIQAAINQVKPGYTDGSLMSADLWKLAPAAGYPWDPMVAWDPIFVYFPAQAGERFESVSGWTAGYDSGSYAYSGRSTRRSAVYLGYGLRLTAIQSAGDKCHFQWSVLHCRATARSDGPLHLQLQSDGTR